MQNKDKGWQQADNLNKIMGEDKYAHIKNKDYYIAQSEGGKDDE